MGICVCVRTCMPFFFYGFSEMGDSISITWKLHGVSYDLFLLEAADHLTQPTPDLECMARHGAVGVSQKELYGLYPDQFQVN